MKMNRRAVTELPVKLLVISIILTVSIPTIMNVAETGQDNMDESQMRNDAQRVSNAVASVYYSPTGSARVIEVDIPDGCHIQLGGDGDDAFFIHMFCGNVEVGKHPIEKPIIPFADITNVYGRASLKVSIEEDRIEVSLL